ncbi:MAG TPA: hypothetical protein VFK49_05215 [Stellaceae bacterium]|nr:hypothetical protein [Stellaceae bacterium]
MLTSRFASLARIATLTLALAPIAGVAYADDEYGTGHAAVIAQAASSQPTAPLTAAQVAQLNDVFKVGQNDAFGGARSSQLAPVPQATASRLASMSRTVDGKIDVVGAGGAQDALAVEIYHPGSGTDF